MDRSLSVTTPESIAFSYELAGLGSRFLAVMIDLLIQIGIVLVIVVGIVLARTQPGTYPRVAAETPLWAKSAAIALIVVVLFAIFFGYFILFEALHGGRTPGKRLVGIRVVRDGGYAIDFGSAVVRNLVRAGEFGLGFYAISAACTLISKQNKRLGDLAAGTVVVRDARTVSLAMLHAQSGAGGPPSPLTPEEQVIVDRFVARRATLAPNIRGFLAARIVDRIRPRLSEELRRLDDEALLERLSAS
ncbi:MAG: RDD family protein [Candidatus Baltobacteraceae bacterium]